MCTCLLQKCFPGTLLSLLSIYDSELTQLVLGLCTALKINQEIDLTSLVLESFVAMRVRQSHDLWFIICSFLRFIVYLTICHISKLCYDYKADFYYFHQLLSHKLSVSYVFNNECLKLLTIFCLEINWINLNHIL